MKQKKLICLLLVLLLLLTGCGKVGQAREAITAIGTVTMESGALIEAAEAMVEQLPEKRQQKVENLSVLTQARAEYDRLNAAVDKAANAILAIGEVSQSSENAIRSAREAYEALAADSLTGYADDYYPILVAAEKQYTFLCAKEIYENALRCFEQGNYSQAMTLLKNLEKEYPNSDFAESAVELDVKCIVGTAEVLYSDGQYDDALKMIRDVLENYPLEAQWTNARDLGAKCYVAKATKLYDQGDLEKAMNMLTALSNEFAGEMYGAGGNELKEKITRELESIRPDNGEVLANVGNLVGGYCEFTVKADSLHDALVKLELKADPDKYLMFYVRAGEQCTIKVQNGNYVCKYTSGGTWYGEEHMFGEYGSFCKADEIMDFTVSYQGAYVYYSAITITLYTTIGGNMSTTPIPEDSF